MDQLINVITNNGIGVACVLYLMYFQHTTMKDIQQTIHEYAISLKDVTNILSIMKQELQEMKDLINKKKVGK